MKKADAVVLDTFAVLAFLGDEAGSEAVADVLERGDAWMTLVNLGEVAYILERRRGKVIADEIFADLLADERPGGGLPIRWLPVNEGLVRGAATLKALGGLSYADCFAAAAAAILGCPVMTGDPEFAAAERAGIAVAWL